MIRALIFDFDGLILETEGPVLQSWQELYQSFGCVLSLTEWVKIIGTADFIFDPWNDLEHQVGRPLDWERLNAQRRARELELVESQSTLPGVKEYLIDARRLQPESRPGFQLIAPMGDGTSQPPGTARQLRSDPGTRGCTPDQTRSRAVS